MAEVPGIALLDRQPGMRAEMEDVAAAAADQRLPVAGREDVERRWMERAAIAKNPSSTGSVPHYCLNIVRFRHALVTFIETNRFALLLLCAWHGAGRSTESAAERRARGPRARPRRNNLMFEGSATTGQCGSAPGGNP